MTAVKLSRPCYTLRPEDEWEDTHYVTLEDAHAAAADVNKHLEPDEPRYGKHPEQLDHRCIEILCDNCDGGLEDEDENSTVHIDSHLDVPTEEARAEALGWVIIRTPGVSNLHFCPKVACRQISRNWTR